MAGLIFASSSGVLWSQKATDLDSRIRGLEADLKILKDGQEVHEAEARLLRDINATGLSSLNTILTVLLAVFTVLGAGGLAWIRTLQNKFQKQLNSGKLANQESQRKNMEIDAEIARLKAASSEQAQQVRDLRQGLVDEFERIRNLIQKREYRAAMGMIETALATYGERQTLLEIKALCHWGLEGLPAAISSGKHTLPNSQRANRAS